jgi:hypothetical protein
MAISIRRYVDIVSGVGAGSGVRNREFIGRMFSTNPLIPTKSLIDFETVEDVGDYFGTSSEEYARATMYFGFISKVITRPRKLTFARWTSTNAAPRIYGSKGQQAVGSWTSITGGTLSMTIGGESLALTGINFAAALSLSDVASIVQTAIRTNTETQYATATVTWNSTRQSFDFVGAFNGNETIEIDLEGANNIAGQLGWGAGAILSFGAAEETPVESISESAEASNNFGSFLFLPALTLQQWVDLGAWNTTQNVLYKAMIPVSAANAEVWSAALLSYWGMAVTLSPKAGEYPEQVPMMILAATVFSRRAASQNYMFQQVSGLTPSVNTNQAAALYDNLRVNYYGQTQTAGQTIQFYQRGTLTGGGTAPVDQNIYANEMWFKDTATAALMELLLNLTRISANAQGRSEVLSTLQTVIDQALFNGVISVEKTLNQTQKLFITQVTGDDLAWHQVQSIGYWLDVVMESFVTQDGRTEWKAVYTVIYSKDDAIRKIEGSHILI